MKNRTLSTKMTGLSCLGQIATRSVSHAQYADASKFANAGESSRVNHQKRSDLTSAAAMYSARIGFLLRNSFLNPLPPLPSTVVPPSRSDIEVPARHLASKALPGLFPPTPRDAALPGLEEVPSLADLKLPLLVLWCDVAGRRSETERGADSDLSGISMSECVQNVSASVACVLLSSYFATCLAISFSCRV